MCMHIHTHTHTHMHGVHTHTHTHARRAHTHTHTHMHGVHTHTHTHTCTVCTHTHTHTCTACTHTHTHTCTACTHTHSNTYTPTQSQQDSLKRQDFKVDNNNKANLTSFRFHVLYMPYLCLLQLCKDGISQKQNLRFTLLCFQKKSLVLKVKQTNFHTCPAVCKLHLK